MAWPDPQFLPSSPTHVSFLFWQQCKGCWESGQDDPGRHETHGPSKELATPPTVGPSQWLRTPRCHTVPVNELMSPPVPYRPGGGGHIGCLARVGLEWQRHGFHSLLCPQASPAGLAPGQSPLSSSIPDPLPRGPVHIHLFWEAFLEALHVQHLLCVLSIWLPCCCLSVCLCP